MTRYLAGAGLVLLWLYLLHALERSRLAFWKYLAGSVGLFLLLMIFLRPLVVVPLGKIVAALAGVIGGLTDTFAAYLKYGILFIDSAKGSITLSIDFECSGVIEIIAYVSLLAFYRVYDRKERLLAGLFGTLYILLANVARVTVICLIIHFGGVQMYYVAHSLVGRLVFYALTVCLYFYVFSKPQIVRMKVGRFNYDGE